MSDYLTTLRRVPDEIILSIAPRTIVPMSTEQCLVAWIAREVVARRWWNRLRRRKADKIAVVGSREICTRSLGGTYSEWAAIFGGIVSNEQAVRRAFSQRIAECAA